MKTEETYPTLPESISDKVKKRDEQAQILLQIIELGKKLTVSSYKIADKLRCPEHIGERDIELLRQEVDNHFWRQCLNELQVEKFLTTKDKEELFKKFDENCPVFNQANVHEALNSFINSRGATAMNMIKKIYKEVTDIHFRTGTNKYGKPDKRIQKEIPKTFRATMFYGYKNEIPRYISSYHSNFALLEDLERAFFLCDGKVQPDRARNITSKTDEALRDGLTKVQGEYFDLEVFKNGNVKITVTNLKVLETLNKWGRKENTLE